ncbi:MAG: DUF680 domain-containing protein [Mesorhizobium sp.]
MKKTILTLAAVLAFSGAAFAGTSQPSTAVCVDTKTNVKLDCSATGSVEKSDAKADSKGPRLGIEINPWIVPSSF